MRSIQPKMRRSPWSVWILALPVVLLAVGGSLATLWLLGAVVNPFARRDDPYVVRLPINSQLIPAYTRVERTHLLNPKTGGLAYQPVPSQAAVGLALVSVATDGTEVRGKVAAVRNVNDTVVFVTEDGREVPHDQAIELGGALLNVNAIIGRVVKRDKRPGLAFREDTFFPRGTPEGIAGATPPGMQSITLDATRLIGVHALHAGDEIDLIASVPVGEGGAFRGPLRGSAGTALVSAKRADGGEVATEPVLLAKKALVLKPVYVRTEATTSSSLTQGKRIQNVPKYEIALAVAADDVIPLQTALDRKLEITCVAHSRQPTSDAPAASEPGGPRAPVTVRPILAYEVITREALVNPATRRIRTEPISQEEIDRLGIIISLDEALGAVARHDIPDGSFLRRSDLLSRPPEAISRNGSPPSRLHFTAHQAASAAQPAPVSRGTGAHAETELSRTGANVVGDRPAISRFIPRGYTAIALPWNRLYGAEYLEIGDHIDLLASYSLEAEQEVEETETRPDGTRVIRKRHDPGARTTLRTWDESLGFRGEPWFVATEAIVVGPVGFPPPAPAQRTLGESLQRAGGATPGLAAAFTGPPVVVAIDDRDVEQVAAALATPKVLFTPAFHGSDQHESLPAGIKRIAVAAQDVEAFQALEETVWQGNRRRPLWRLVREDDPRFRTAIEADAIASYYGRVLREGKRRGEFFVEDDFLPPGARPGVAADLEPESTLLAVADREIEGLDTFQAGDRVAILSRGVVAAPEGVIAHGIDLARPVSSVIVPQARIVRPSRGGQTVLEIQRADVTRLQAAWAASQVDGLGGGAGDQRSQLVAVALPRPTGEQPDDRLAASAAGPEYENEAIPDYDPAGQIRLLEALVGDRREVHAFAGAPEAPSVERAVFLKEGRK